MPDDLDQGGNLSQWTKVYLGPTLGWVMVQVKPERFVTVAGETTLDPGDGIALVNVAGAVTINLPDVVEWLKQSYGDPTTAFERGIWIKDLSGQASVNNITVHPFDTQEIDGLAMDFEIIQDHQLLRLYPLTDLSGWYSG